MENKKVKITNPYGFRQGLKLMDGVREVVVHPKSFIYIDKDEIYYINNIASTFSRKKLIVHDDEVNQNLGLDLKDDIVSLNDDEIKEILSGHFTSMKKKLSEINDKHIIDRVVEIARTIEDLAQGKLKYLQEISGYEFEQLIKSE